MYVLNSMSNPYIRRFPFCWELQVEHLYSVFCRYTSRVKECLRPLRSLIIYPLKVLYRNLSTGFPFNEDSTFPEHLSKEPFLWLYLLSCLKKNAAVFSTLKESPGMLLWNPYNRRFQWSFQEKPLYEARTLNQSKNHWGALFKRVGVLVEPSDDHICNRLHIMHTHR